jgi:hypothetical protein
MIVDIVAAQLSKSGVYTSVRFSFAFFADDECNGDVTPTKLSVLPQSAVNVESSLASDSP